MESLTFTPRLASRLHVRIIEGDSATCEALSLFFRLEGFQTSFTADCDSALSGSPPDILIINLALPKSSGINVLLMAKAQLPGVPAVMLADQANVGEVVQAMKCGAVDVIQKPLDTERLLPVVRDALKRNIQVGAMRDGVRSVEICGFPHLTPKEREVLKLVMDGHTNKSAALILEKSPRTVEIQRRQIIKKLGAKNTAELVRLVFTA